MRHTLSTLVMVLCSIALVSCIQSPPFPASQPTTATPSGSSGIEGTITVGPISPVTRAGMPNERPYQAKVAVLDANGQIITQFESDATGKFRVLLKPGTYVIQPTSPAQYPHAAEQMVEVVAGQFTHVAIAYDRGIR